MSTSKTLWFVMLALALLVACNSASNPSEPAPAPAAPAPQNGGFLGIPVFQSGATPTPDSGQFPQGITNEPLAVVTTSPADKSDQAPVAKDKLRLIVQFNHPVVPLVAVEAQKDLPQPLALQPAVQGTGQWINTSTFAFTPSQNLAVATQYTASLQPLKDMLGQSLNNYSWSFKTTAPAVLSTGPGDNTQYFGVSRPVTMTFNTEMDRASTESRFSVTRQDTRAPVTGKLEWQGLVLRFVPDKPFEYDTAYLAQLKTGAQDANKVAGTLKDVSWTFRTSARPAVTSTTPRDGEGNANIGNSFRIDFASPMDQDNLKLTIQPTITNRSVWWESSGGKYAVVDSSLIARVGGGWLASTAYTVTIGADSLTRFGEKLGKETVVRFTTQPRAPQLDLAVPNDLGMYDANGIQRIFATYVNLNQIDYKLYKVDRADLLGLVGNRYFDNLQKYTPKQPNLLRTWSVKPQAPLNASSVVSTTLTADGTSLQPGIYYLEASAPNLKNSDLRPQKHLLVVSAYNLALKRTETEALVWVTDLKSGQPVANQPLTLYDTRGQPLATGKSDQDGVWRTKFARQNSWDPIYVLSESSGQVVAAVGSDWNSGIMSWDFNIPGSPGAQPYYSNLYTDRAIYRPGQTVYFKGILRSDNDAQYSLPQGIETVPVSVNDATGKQIARQNVPLSRFGTFNGEIKLSDSASIGGYSLILEMGQDPDKYTANVFFQVAEYSPPQFKVSVSTDKPEYINGDTLRLEATASYFFGGALKDGSVVWRLLSDDYAFQPPNVKGWWDFTDYDLSNQPAQGGVIREGKGKTDANGRFAVQVPADLKDHPLSQNFTLEVEVTDINNQVVNSRTVVPVHKASYYIGLKPQRYIGTANQEQAVDAITVNTKGVTVTNQALTVSFFKHEWYSVKEKQDNGSFFWKSAYTDTLVSKVNLTTDAQGTAVARFTPKEGGVYRIIAEGQDAAKNPVRSSTYLWVSGGQFINWRMENNDRIDLVADKKEYNVGDTAQVLVPSPFQNAQALLTIERGTIRQVRRLTLAGNSEQIKVPITSDLAPNVFVSVLLVKGRGADGSPPEFKLGYTNLQVATTEKQLKITIAPDKKTNYQPGDKATFNIQVTDSKDKPVQAELSVALVDAAIQSLAEETAQSPLQAFYGERGLGVQTSTTLVRSVERVNQQLTPEAKGGGGGLLQQPVRRDFRDTAFWKADLVTDAAGRASVSVPLPDNLTTWNLTAKGVTAATQVGVARTDVVSTKDLLLQVAPPRFVVVGDKVHLEAVVQNRTDKDVSADVRLDAQGLTLSGSAQQPVTVRANDKNKVAWDVTVNPVEQVILKFSATGGGLNDAVELPLPVLRPTSAEAVATAGQVDTRTTEQIQLPSVIDKSAGELRVDLSPSLAAASRDSLDYLDSFEYECTEQTVSKFLPNVATYLALKRLGINRPDLQRNLETNVTREVQRLYALQNQDGGWGWWVNDASRQTLTAYALLGLYNARQAGYAVDAQVMNRARQYLVNSFDKPLDANAAYTYNERAFVIYVLVEMGDNYTSRSVSLFDQRANLGNYGKAYLLMAMKKLKLTQAQTLEAELASAAIQSATGAHWEEAKIDYWTMNTNTRSTALAIMALSYNAQGTPSALLSNAVRWLMVARKEGHWETTQETAWSVLALTQFMQSTDELQGNYSYQVTVNGKTIGNGKVDKSNVDQAATFKVAVKDLVTSAANDLTINRTGTGGRLYYSAYLNYYLPVENIQALNKGIIVARQYEGVDPQTLKPTGKLVQSAKVGDYVQVTLTVIAPNDLHYLVLEDPLPAGFEAVDTTLKTASVAASSPTLRNVNQTQDRWSLPYWSYWAHSEVRDDRVAAFATYLGRGTYEYSYMMHASVAGQFRTLPARAWEMYFPDTFGRSSAAVFTVTP